MGTQKILELLLDGVKVVTTLYEICRTSRTKNRNTKTRRR